MTANINSTIKLLPLLNDFKLEFEKLPEDRKGTPLQNRKIQEIGLRILALIKSSDYSPRSFIRRTRIEAVDRLVEFLHTTENKKSRISAGGGFFRYLTRSKTECISSQTITAVSEIISEVTVSRDKIRILQESRISEPSTEFLLKYTLYAHKYEADRRFVMALGRNLANYIATNISLIKEDAINRGFSPPSLNTFTDPEAKRRLQEIIFPFASKQEIEEVGLRISKKELIAPYCAFYGLDVEEFTAKNLEFSRRTEKFLQDVLGNGICMGLSLARMSPLTRSSDSAELFRKGRFLQAAYQLQRRLVPYGSPKEIGEDLLENSSLYPQALLTSAHILGFDTTEELLAAARCIDSKERISTILGNIEVQKQFDPKKEVAESSAEDAVKNESKNRESLAISQLLNGKSRGVDFPRVPQVILNNQHLAQKQMRLEGIPREELYLQMLILNKIEGDFCLIGTGGPGANHAMNLSTQPPTFFDMNDLSDTFKPRLRTFCSFKEMMEFLLSYLPCKYPEYTHFDLQGFEKVESSIGSEAR